MVALEVSSQRKMSSASASLLSQGVIGFGHFRFKLKKDYIVQSRMFFLCNFAKLTQCSSALTLLI